MPVLLLDEDALVNVDHAARVLERHRSTLYEYMKLPEDDPRHLPSVLIGAGARRILTSELAALRLRLETMRIANEATADVYSMGAPAIGRRLGISSRSAARLLASGAIRSRWVGTQRRARPEDVDDYLAGLG